MFDTIQTHARSRRRPRPGHRQRSRAGPAHRRPDPPAPPDCPTPTGSRSSRPPPGSTPGPRPGARRRSWPSTTAPARTSPPPRPSWRRTRAGPAQPARPTPTTTSACCTAGSGMEVALVLSISTVAADREVDFALGLREHPQVRHALADGLIHPRPGRASCSTAPTCSTIRPIRPSSSPPSSDPTTRPTATTTTPTTARSSIRPPTPTAHRSGSCAAPAAPSGRWLRPAPRHRAP